MTTALTPDDTAALDGARLLTVEEAARRLSLGRTTVYALLKTGEITSVRVGRLRRIPAEALDTYTAHLVAEQGVD
jgi:excisionase family DNA binding protein